MSLFDKLSIIPPDPILKIISEYNEDIRSNKIDLGVGVYRDSFGETPIMSVIKSAESHILSTQKSKAYIGLAGDANYNKNIQKLILGDIKIAEDRIFTIQTAGGTTSLRVASELLKETSKNINIWVSNPTWSNHIPVLKSTNISYREYPYYDVERNTLLFDKMVACLEDIPKGDAVLLHACCHNPTGMDPTLEQWKEIIQVMKSRELLPFVDNAYQGLANGLDEDASALRLMISEFNELIISSSCSKNFGLYRDRVGALTVITNNEDSNKKTKSNVLKIVRTMCSVPPDHGAACVGYILSDESLTQKWKCELDDVKIRLKNMRKELAGSLKNKTNSHDFSHIVRANGMFSFLGITKEQVQALKSHYGIYMEESGRINVAGITMENVSYLTDSIAEVLESHQ